MAMTQGSTNGRHVVIAGGSFAGLGAAYTLRERLPPDHRVTLIAPTDQFVFAPSLIWAALGHPLRHSSFALEPALTAKGIQFVRASVRQVQLDDHRLQTDEGEMPYDRLVIATGGYPDTGAIPGLAGEFRAASWVVGEDSALEARTVLRALRQAPGPLIVGAAQNASYLSAAYELVLALDTALRREKLRHRIPITFVTAEPYLGQLGFGQTAARPTLERLFAQRSIETRVGVHILQVQRTEVTVSGGETLPARASVIMPPFTGALAIWKSAGLTNPRGMIAVTERYQHLERSDVYAAGVAASFAKPVPPLGGYRAPHTAYLSLHMGKAAGQNVAASLGHGSPPARPLPAVVDVRVLDGGDVGLFLLSHGTRELHHHALQLPGRAAHLLKASIERYVLWQLRTGRMHLP